MDPEQRAREGVVDRSSVIAAGVRAGATWSWRLIVVGVAGYLLFRLLGTVRVGVLPILLAVLVATVLWPPVGWLRRHRWPPPQRPVSRWSRWSWSRGW